MALQANIYKRVFHFSFDARTSRGAVKEKVSWFITVWDDGNPEITGTGECGPLPGLSIEHTPELEDKLTEFIERFNALSIPIANAATLSELHGMLINVLGAEVLRFSSLLFAFETALLDFLQGGNKIIFRNSFVTGAAIPINGLIWMGGMDFMLQQIEIKIRDGFTCLKLKVGSHDFEKECDVLQYIRRKYYKENITIRLDANGAFKPHEAMFKLQQLARFEVHSIEQPIKPGLEMDKLCRESPIPIALDEELIGVCEPAEKQRLLDRVMPQYLILKPTLHGGLFGCEEWIALAESRGIGWWITSALESNIGLNAIAQFAAQYPMQMPHGLGTGAIYTDNIDSPLTVKKGLLYYKEGLEWAPIANNS